MTEPRYRVILADPPWSYRDKASAGRRGAAFKYPTMSLDTIAALPVQGIAADDCALFLWATAPQMETALQVLHAWGFEYITVVFTWVKRTSRTGALHWGMGNWSRSNPEFVLLGRVGRPRRVDAGVHSVVESVRGRHSAKPAEVRDRIVTMMGDVSRIELFARERAPGWDAWGDEVDCDVQL